MQLPVAVTTLGDRNRGSFGPQKDDPITRERLALANADLAYGRPATKRYLCVDGRCSQRELDTAASDQSAADPQIPGGQAVFETAIDFMVNPAPLSLAQTVAQKTAEAQADGFVVTAHGANNNRSGCAANADLRQVLLENQENQAVVVPLVQALLGAIGQTQVVTDEQLTQLIKTGAQNAESELLWDASADDVTRIVEQHGGEYIDLIGAHQEAGIRVDIAPGAVRKAALMQSVSTPEMTTQQFIASLGQYAQDSVTRFTKRGESQADIALHVAAAVLYTVGISKHLATKHMPVFLVTS